MINLTDVLRNEPVLLDLYTRKEEYSRNRLDQHDQFISLYGNYQDLLEPLVSRFLTERGFAVEFPDGKPFAVCLTHDVDEIYPPREHILLSSLTSLGDFDLTSLRDQISWKFSGKEKSPYRTFKKIMDLEEKYGACSSFYFLATGSDILRFRYDIEDLENEVRQITERGSEVGLHGGYYAYHNMEEMLKEKRRLEKVAGKQITGYRNHYLRFRVPDSWELLKRAGFLYDSTLGYNEAVGFRNGMCHPFYPYNLNTRSEIDILEIPLALMDCTLFESTQSCNDAWVLAKRVIDTVNSYRGVLCINWHSNNFNCPFRKKWEMLYEKLLDYCYHKNAWMTSGEHINSWWKKNAW